VAETRTYTLNVNNKNYPVTADSETPLLWVLRDLIGLTGTKYGCGIERCYACSVLVNGQVEHACVFDATSAIGKKVTTIEGLSADGSHPLQKAWVAEQVPQCGYCQSGMLVAAVGLLKEHPRPSDSDIDSGLGNICACGTYPRVRKAVKRAAGV
jgi:isoquinoline 1-oxidoreductase subunit alpha